MVPHGNASCDACGHTPPLHISCPAKGDKGDSAGTGRAGKGKGKEDGKGKGEAKGSGKHKPGESFAERQLRSQLAASKAELAKTNRSLAEARKAAAAALQASTSQMAVDEAGDTDSKADLKAMRGHLKALRELPSVLQATPNIADAIVELDSKIRAAIVAQREAQPLDVQLLSTEAHVTRMEKLEAAACQKTAELQAQQTELTRQLEEQCALQYEAEAKTLGAKEELARIKASLALNLSAEAGVAHAADPSGVVVPPGCVSIKYAEAVLAEQLALRDAALAQAITVAEDAPEEPDEDTASLAGSASNLAADEGCKKKARKQRAIGAKATIAHVRGHNFAKPKWG